MACRWMVRISWVSSCVFLSCVMTSLSVAEELVDAAPIQDPPKTCVSFTETDTDTSPPTHTAGVACFENTQALLKGQPPVEMLGLDDIAKALAIDVARLPENLRDLTCGRDQSGNVRLAAVGRPEPGKENVFKMGFGGTVGWAAQGLASTVTEYAGTMHHPQLMEGTDDAMVSIKSNAFGLMAHMFGWDAEPTFSMWKPAEKETHWAPTEGVVEVSVDQHFFYFGLSFFDEFEKELVTELYLVPVKDLTWPKVLEIYRGILKAMAVQRLKDGKTVMTTVRKESGAEDTYVYLRELWPSQSDAQRVLEIKAEDGYWDELVPVPLDDPNQFATIALSVKEAMKTWVATVFTLATGKWQAGARIPINLGPKRDPESDEVRVDKVFSQFCTNVLLTSKIKALSPF